MPSAPTALTVNPARERGLSLRWRYIQRSTSRVNGLRAPSKAQHEPEEGPSEAPDQQEDKAEGEDLEQGFFHLPRHGEMTPRVADALVERFDHPRVPVLNNLIS